MKIYNLFLAILFLTILSIFSACSVEISPTQTVQGVFTQLPATPTNLIIPNATPTQEFAFSSVAASSMNLHVMPGYPTDLQGQLIFLSTLEDGLQALVTFDFSTEEASILVATPKAWLLAQSVFPDTNESLIAYAPPPVEGKPSYGYTDLYLLNPDGSIIPVLQRTDDIEAFFGSFFSPDGDFVYYSHFFADSTAPSGFRYHINRFAYPDGLPEVVVENAFWERLSSDGEKLAYVTFDGREFDELFVANADGSDPIRALDPDEFQTVDAPFFSPDNQSLYFSAISVQTTPLTWWEKLLGVHLALAHSVPSDFWRVSLRDSSVIQITHLQDQGMYGTFSPDGEKIAFISATGLYIMNPDGSGLVQLFASTRLYGTLEWIP